MSDSFDDVDMELDSILGNRKIEEPKIAFEYFYVNVNRNPHLMTLKYLPDSNGVPLRVITGVRDGLIKDVEGKDFRVRICDESNFKKLTEKQSMILRELHKESNRYQELNPELAWKLKAIPQFVIFFGVMTQMGDICYNQLKTTVFYSGSVNFVKYFQKFINDSKVKYGSDWLKDHFNRDLTLKGLVSVIANRIKYGYEFKFDSVEGDGIICQELVDRANDLNEEYIDINNFNEELYSETLMKLKKVNGD